MEKKPLIIALISLGAIAALILLLIFGQGMFVGKAYYSTGKEINIGVDKPTGKIYANKEFDITIKANILDKNTTALQFQLNLGSLSCKKVTSLLGWENKTSVLHEARCSTDSKKQHAHFKYATLNGSAFKTGQFEIAKITIAPATAKTHKIIGFTKKGDYALQIVDADTSKNLTIIAKQDAIITVEPGCTSGQTSCSGTCTNLKTDSNNCGSCGKKCSTGQSCVSGSCKTSTKCTDADKDNYCKETTNLPTGKKGGDCNDTNSSFWKKTTAYKDNDDDGYGAGTAVTVCQGSKLPKGYSLVKTDCNDTFKTVTTCLSTQTCTAGICKNKTTYQCIGTTPGNATICSGTSTGLIKNTSKKLVAKCSTTKCTYQCKTGYTFNISKCSPTKSLGLSGSTCKTNANCKSPLVCTSGKCATKLTPAIKLTIGGSSTLTSLSKTKTNTITATLTADKNLPSHLFLVKILDSKGSDAAVHYQPKKALTKGSSETISFNFKPDSTGNHTIKAYAWTKWVSQKGQSLGNNYKATGNYEIK